MKQQEGIGRTVLRKTLEILFSIPILCSTVAVGAVLTTSFASAAEPEMVVFAIPSQPLRDSLLAFSKQSGIQVIITANFGEQVSPAVNGAMTKEHALDALLKGRDVEYIFTGSTTVTIREKAASSKLKVEAAPVVKQPDMPSKAHDVPDRGAQIETIVVTAQHRVEKSQDVPVSIQVIDGQVQSTQNLNSLHTMIQTQPSMHVGNTGRNSDLYIRGIGSGGNQSFDQSVGMFIDGIYHGRSRTSASTFLDLERVEILKGPQSTYFGNNAIGGALNIVTRKPSSESEASARVFYAPRAGQYAVEATGGGALSDTISARATVLIDGMKGWAQNVNGGRDVPKEENIAGRVSLFFKPNADLNATLKIEASDNKNSGQVLQMENCPPPPPFVAAGFCKAALALGNFPVGSDGNKISVSQGTEIKLDTREIVLTINYNRGGHAFTSVTGFTKYNFTQNLDNDASPLTLFNVQSPENHRQFSQEFRVASPVNQPIEYLAGVYFQRSNLYVEQELDFYFLSPVINSAPPFTGLRPYLPLGQKLNFTQEENVTSLFGSLSWNATDRLKLTGELRGSRVEKDFNGNLFYGTATREFGGTTTPWPASVQQLVIPLGLGVPHTLSASRTDDGWTPSVKIQYKINPASMVYASYAKGFKAGGFNGVDTSGVASRLPFGPEHVDAYEVGVKNKWDKTLLNVSLFRSDYTGLQLAQNLPTAAGSFVNLVSNDARAMSQGVEIEGQWAVSPSFRLAAQATYLDAHYTSYPGVSPTAAQILAGMKIQDLSGRPTEYAPRWSGSVTGTYKTRLANDYRMTAALTPHYSSSYFFTALDDDLLKQESYVRLDGRLTFESPDRKWAFDVIGQNLTNKTIRITGSPVVSSVGSVQTLKQAPWSIGFQVRYSL